MLKTGVISLTILIVTFITPQVALATTRWDLKITSPNGTTTGITYEELLALPETNVTANLACYGTPIAYGDWQGVRLSDILNQAGLDPSVASIDFLAQDGYTVSIPIDTAMRQDVIVAYDMNGVSLPETLRLVVPGANGNIWISMITAIGMSTTPLINSMTSPGQALFSQNQYLNHIANNAILQPSPQKPQPTPSTYNAASEPTSMPTNATQSSVQKTTGQEGSNSSFQAIYFVALGFAFTLVAVSFVVYRHRKLKA